MLRVGIALSGKEINVKGLYDTGNCLYDRATGKSVCVMERTVFSIIDGETTALSGKFLRHEHGRRS